MTDKINRPGGKPWSVKNQVSHNPQSIKIALITKKAYPTYPKPNINLTVSCLMWEATKRELPTTIEPKISMAKPPKITSAVNKFSPKPYQYVSGYKIGSETV